MAGKAEQLGAERLRQTVTEAVGERGRDVVDKITATLSDVADKLAAIHRTIMDANFKTWADRDVFMNAVAKRIASKIKGMADDLNNPMYHAGTVTEQIRDEIKRITGVVTNGRIAYELGGIYRSPLIRHGEVEQWMAAVENDPSAIWDLNKELAVATAKAEAEAKTAEAAARAAGAKGFLGVVVGEVKGSEARIQAAGKAVDRGGEVEGSST